MLSPDRQFLISPPFGTYFTHPKAYSVLGSFTPSARPGRLHQIIRTVRPVPGGWINKIGLRNPGMQTLIHHPVKSHQVISLALIDGDRGEWDQIIAFVLDYTGRYFRNNPVFEINVSCPNTNHPIPAVPDADQLRRLLKTESGINGSTIIFKLQPLSKSLETVMTLANSGVKYIHLSNTLPSPIGGISGMPLLEQNLPLVDKATTWLVNARITTEIIAGGGIYCAENMRQYADVGASRFSLSTAFFWPPRAYRVMSALHLDNSGDWLIRTPNSVLAPKPPITGIATPRSSSIGPIRDLADSALIAEWHYWTKKIDDAPGWGAAVAVATKFQNDCSREMERRGIVVKDILHHIS